MRAAALRQVVALLPRPRKSSHTPQAWCCTRLAPPGPQGMAKRSRGQEGAAGGAPGAPRACAAPLAAPAARGRAARRLVAVPGPWCAV